MPLIIQEIIDLLLKIGPFILQLISVLKGQPTQVKVEALSKSLGAAKEHVDGVNL